MKKIVFAFIFSLATCLSLSAQESAPEDVAAAFRSKYPKAKNVEWVKTGDSQWQAEFVASDREVRVVFDEAGTWLGSQTEIDTKKAPEAVQKTVAEKYKGYEIVDVTMVEIYNGEVMYKYDLDKGDGEIETMFHADGRIVTQAQEMEEADMEEDDAE